MYSASVVARYIIKKCNELNKSISNLKLQKILYFIQAEFLVSTKECCFPEKICAWDFGPVVPEVYHEYKIYGSASIPYVEGKHAWTFTENDMAMIDGIVNQCAEYSASTLVQITHQQSPWQTAYKRFHGAEITLESIKDFFMEA